MTATEIADAVHAGELTARAATEQALERITQRDNAIHAFRVVRTEGALAEADAVDDRADRAELPLAGVPIAVKDNVPVAGESMRIGSFGSDSTPQRADHAVVARLRAAGAVIVGLTAVPELCVFGATDSAFGITHNPWDLDRTPGGSSGGSAAAVAAGMVAIAHGNDGMGSIRIPAACCGLVGLKPGLGVVPAELGNGSWFDMAENGPLATTVADCALLFSVLAGRAELRAVTEPPALRIAVSTKAPVPATPVDHHYADAARAAGALLADAGHRVRAADPAYPIPVGLSALVRWFAGAELDARGLADRSRLEKRTARHAAIGKVVLKAGLPKAAGRTKWQRRAEAFFADHDVLLTPTLAQLPLPAKPWGEAGWAANVWANTHYAPFAAPWNLAGWPAMALPFGVHPNGMPLSIQLAGRPGTEATLLALAAQLEQLRPWIRTAPR
ncbi:MAG: amidase family protein [Mycobacteriaceae bacterium]